MKKLLRHIEGFWFGPMATTGFGLMRVAFGVITFVSFFWQWEDVTRYYSDAGMLPREIMGEFLRDEWRLTIFNFIGDPTYVFAIYLVLLATLVFVIVGMFTRPALLMATLLIFSFHERNPSLLAGGDTVMRHIAFMLLLAPSHRSFSVWSLKKRFAAWMRKKTDPVRALAVMPAWPYRLLLWQFIMIYIASLWTKLHGSMWRDGSAVEIVLHHEHFLRFPAQMMMPLLPLGVLTGHFLLFAQGSWGMLVLGPILAKIFPPARSAFSQALWRRIAILSNAWIHLMIFLLMDVGIFSLIIFSGYLGLLRSEDFAALRRLINIRFRKPIAVLYDGHCGLCRRSVFGLMILDWLKRLQLIDFHDATKRNKVAPKLTFSALDKALHVILPDGKVKKGFGALRALAWHMPALWPAAPLLYIPGIQCAGDKVYAHIANRRKKCVHENCEL